MKPPRVKPTTRWRAECLSCGFVCTARSQSAVTAAMHEHNLHTRRLTDLDLDAIEEALDHAEQAH